MRALIWIGFCAVLMLSSCSKSLDELEPSCTDGIQNQGETAIDCGGPCTGACPTCSDGIRNQGEASIDCGGPCSACATIDCTYCTSSTQASNQTYCEDDFVSQDAYETAVYNAIANGWICN